MHELSLCYGLLDQVERVARENQANRVIRIVLQIGPLSGAEPELIRAAFSVAAAGSVAEGAELVTERAAVVVVCHSCGAQGEVPANRLLCPACGGWQTRVASGDELIMSSLELEREDTPCATAATTRQGEA
ncbi:hydrogenase nickel insertion protein HypA [Magnetococcus marinus MC-1]|uniref:Hydrogenase maturation factor HypA n=1 Tax=Magnetococcus marinus (strain ATCC BAA-1437 / JCM 17883 / MC-1) TaxID=156889 RepID=A0LAJ6_MAGMM|nr:hydrogenase maturation nickel metallochaperone HypA [Magnetococcus marinus]ABK44989.1 hydrogenase nickel insertion protein HypA [Magnetococcus marinus MC-1]